MHIHDCSNRYSHDTRGRATRWALVVALGLGLAPAPAAAKGKAAARGCGTKAECAAKKKAEARRQALASALFAAEEERVTILARAQAIGDAGDPEGMVAHLEDAVERTGDAILAVEVAAAASHVLGRGGEAATRAAIERARALLAAVPDFDADPTLDPKVARVAIGEVPALLRRCDTLEAIARGRERQDVKEAQLRRRGRMEVRAGAGLLSLGVGGLGLLIGGLGVEADRQAKLEPIRGHEAEYDLTSLDAQHDRANAMIGVGAVVGAIGVSAGAALLGVGVRDLRRGGGRLLERAQLRVAPGPGGVVVMGRF